MKDYASVAVTGTHGKTSTTGLLAHVLSGYQTTNYLIGDGTGFAKEDATYFAFEACEYKRHFLSYIPDYAIMTNIEFDHPDYFSDVEDVFSAFQELALHVKKGIIAYGDDEQLQRIQSKVPVVYYGFNENNDFHARNIVKSEQGSQFDVFVRNEFYGHFEIIQPGEHNILNALSVIALAHYENIDISLIQEQLKSFTGVKRRFQAKTLPNQQISIDDYAHHPTAIRVTLQAARQKYPERNLIAIFQPHTYSRTRVFLEEFAEELKKADVVYLCEIFGSAREESSQGSIHQLQNLIPGSAILEVDHTSVLEQYKEAVLLFMGAGDVTKFMDAYEKSVSK